MACKLACVGLTQPVSNRAAAAHSCAWNAHAGNYRISGKLSIARNVVLRGAGTARTTLTFVNSLSDLDGPRTDTNGAATAHAAQWLGDWHAALRCNTGTVCCISMMSKLPYTRQLMPRGWRAAACVPCRRERVQEQRGAAGLPRAQPLLSLHRTGQCHTGEGRAAPECAGHRLAAVHDAYHAPCGWPLRGADVFVPPPPPTLSVGHTPSPHAPLPCPCPQAASRGDTKLYVDDSRSIWPGDWLRLTLDNPANASLSRAMTGGLWGPQPNKPRYVRISLRVTSVNEDGSISFNRPLPLDVSLDWAPVLHWGWSGMRVAGVESLTLRFPETDYGGPGGCWGGGAGSCSRPAAQVPAAPVPRHHCRCCRLGAAGCLWPAAA